MDGYYNNNKKERHVITCHVEFVLERDQEK